MKHSITTDGITVWVNAASCLGRFGRFGIDIHRDLSQQSAKGDCLYCTHVETTAHDWDTFVTKMKELHGIRVPKRYRPERFNT